MKLLFDTNIFIYHFNNQLTEPGTALLRAGIVEGGAYSVITLIEDLGYEQPESAESRAKQLLNQLIELPLTSEIAERTIAHSKKLENQSPGCHHCGYGSGVFATAC